MSRQDFQVFNRLFSFHESDLDVGEELLAEGIEGGFHYAPL